MPKGRQMKSDTFGNNKSDVVLAEHLTAHADQATWACRAISKTTRLLSDLKSADIKNPKFKRTVYSYIKCAMQKHVSNPPTHIDEKTASYTANIISRHLTNFFHEHVMSEKSRQKMEERAKNNREAAVRGKYADRYAQGVTVICMNCKHPLKSSPGVGGLDYWCDRCQSYSAEAD